MSSINVLHPPPDTLTDTLNAPIRVLTRREVEARILAPIIIHFHP